MPNRFCFATGHTSPVQLKPCDFICLFWMCNIFNERCFLFQAILIPMGLRKRFRQNATSLFYMPVSHPIRYLIFQKPGYHLPWFLPFYFYPLVPGARKKCSCGEKPPYSQDFLRRIIDLRRKSITFVANYAENEIIHT